MQQSLPGMGVQRISKSECLAAISAPIAAGHGFRHLWIGYTGSGKTYAAIETLDATADAHDITLVTEQKTRRDKDSIYTTALGYSAIPHIEALDAVAPDGLRHRQAVIRGFGLTGDPADFIDFDSLASKIWQRANAANGVLLGIDELSDACAGERTWLKGSYTDNRRAWMRMLYQQGRENQVSIVACTQHVQEIPRTAISNSDTLGIFRQDRKELPYYAQSNFLDKDELEIVANLEQYDFLFLRRGYPSAICRF